MIATSPIASLMESGGDPPSRNLSLKDSLLVRDALTGIVGKGLTDLKDQNVKNNYSYLRFALGNSAAQKLITQAMVFNQRKDITELSPDRRVQAFYGMGSSDPDTHSLIQRLGALGTGPVGGLNSSPDLLNMIASKRDTSTGPGAGTANVRGMTNTMAGLR